MKRADDTTRLLVKAALVKRDDPFMSLGEAAKIVKAGRVVETGRSKEPALAYVNEGKWVADCPECRGGELVAEGHDFLCGSCGVSSRVVWPKKAEEIERLLAKRPIGNQHWLPTESIAELAAQNIENKIWEEM